MAVLNNLYPPVVDTYAPAFLIDSASTAKNTCKVYFSISAFNDIDDIKNAQVSVSYQNTNKTALSSSLYPSAIKVCSVSTDSTRESDDKYYISILPSDLEDGAFEINQYYKIQIRFTSTDAATVSMRTPQSIDSWLAANQAYFSEWSTVVLARGISTPTLTIPGFDTAADYTVWTVENIDVVGSITFADDEETETLKSYRIRLYNDLGTLLTDSGTVYASNYVSINEILYTFEYAFQDGEYYQMVVDYTTKLLYEDSYTYDFMVVLGTSGTLDVTLSSVKDAENGRIGLSIVSSTTEKFTGNLTIRRCSSENNYTLWSDVYTLSIENELLNLTWYDSTVKSGVWYRYCVQKRDSLGNRGVIKELSKPVMIIFDHMYLTGQGQQLNIKFNPQISSFQYTVSETKTDTIGSQYPFIKRNGETFYRSFPISGLISYMEDGDELMTSREEVYGDQLDDYDEYNEENRITIFNDITYERDFRDAVMTFLYDNNVKAFRSATEGNILVKLMNITFTPETTLGRMLYTFSCDAYEIAEFTIANCDAYDIQSVGDLNTNLAYQLEYNGYYDETIAANEEVLTLLQEKYDKLTTAGYINTVDYLDYLKLEFTSDPYLIKETSSGVYAIDDTATDWDTDPESAYLGYIVYINDEAIVINPEGIYELKSEGLQITSLYFPVDTDVYITYHTSVSQVEDKSLLPKTIEYFDRNGQRWGMFSYKNSVYSQIWSKYYEQYSTYYQSVLTVDEVSIEADPGTVVYVAESGETSYEKFIINDTARLDFADPASVVIGMYFAGIHFEEATEAELSRIDLPYLRFRETGIVVTSLDDVEDPIKNGVYILSDAAGAAEISEDYVYEALSTIAATSNDSYDDLISTIADDEDLAEEVVEETTGSRYIYYNEQWWVITDNNDVIQPVEAIVNYHVEIQKGWYAE